MTSPSREQAKADGLKFYSSGKPCRRGHLAQRRVADYICLECQREGSAKWRNENKDAERERHIRWVAANREQRNAKKNKWRRGRKDMRVAENNRRRARKRNAGGSHSAADIREITRLQKGKCAWCRVSFSKKRRHVDHIEPLARGGHNGRQNLQMLCETCNTRKSWKDPIVFAQQQGRLL
jgi:5-methylcytosine-specific restriction endonuclease McrA